jgi:hypothetical protein
MRRLKLARVIKCQIEEEDEEVGNTGVISLRKEPSLRNFS